MDCALELALDFTDMHRALGVARLDLVVATHAALDLADAEKLDMTAHAVSMGVLAGAEAAGAGHEPEYDAW